MEKEEGRGKESDDQEASGKNVDPVTETLGGGGRPSAHLVKLIGYCLEDDYRLLVYEFLTRGSLENHLFRRGSYFQPLSWCLRLKVALGAAKGLAFLHCAETSIIYRDFKTSNILLDSAYNAKLSDFGLAKDGPVGDKIHVSTRVIGTYGYAAPKYLATGGWVGFFSYDTVRYVEKKKLSFSQKIGKFIQRHSEDCKKTTNKFWW